MRASNTSNNVIGPGAKQGAPPGYKTQDGSDQNGARQNNGRAAQYTEQQMQQQGYYTQQSQYAQQYAQYGGQGYRQS